MAVFKEEVRDMNLKKVAFPEGAFQVVTAGDKVLIDKVHEFDAVMDLSAIVRTRGEWEATLKFVKEVVDVMNSDFAKPGVTFNQIMELAQKNYESHNTIRNPFGV